MSAEALLSVGIDIGTTTTQVVFSRLTLENAASSFTVPDIAITKKEILYRSPAHFTPLRSAAVIDADGVRRIVDGEYRAANIRRAQVQTGAVIITGETARKENADEVLSSLSGYAGDFVVATAGPALEGILAGKGAGCAEWSKSLGRDVLNLDIGGGTANMALFRDGQAVDTGCLNVGGRLVRYDAAHRVDYISPVVAPDCGLHLGQIVTPELLAPVAQRLCQVLCQSLALEAGSVPERFITDKLPTLPEQFPLLCFSGGVADTIAPNELSWDAFGDLGVLLGQAIRSSALLQQQTVPAQQTLRATVVGAGSHSTELSGSTIDYHAVRFPMKNLPVIALTPEQEALPPERLAQAIGLHAQRHAHSSAPEQTVLALDGGGCKSFAGLCRLADGVAAGLSPQLTQGCAAVIAVRSDLGKALGQALRARLGQIPLVCLDGVALREGMYLDIGSPVADGQALPVVVKTLILS